MPKPHRTKLSIQMPKCLTGQGQRTVSPSGVGHTSAPPLAWVAERCILTVVFCLMVVSDVSSLSTPANWSSPLCLFISLSGYL